MQADGVDGGRHSEGAGELGGLGAGGIQASSNTQFPNSWAGLLEAASFQGVARATLAREDGVECWPAPKVGGSLSPAAPHRPGLGRASSGLLFPWLSGSLSLEACYFYRY